MNICLYVHMLRLCYPTWLVGLDVYTCIHVNMYSCIYVYMYTCIYVFMYYGTHVYNC